LCDKNFTSPSCPPPCDLRIGIVCSHMRVVDPAPITRLPLVRDPSSNQASPSCSDWRVPPLPFRRDPASASSPTPAHAPLFHARVHPRRRLLSLPALALPHHHPPRLHRHQHAPSTSPFAPTPSTSPLTSPAPSSSLLVRPRHRLLSLPVAKPRRRCKAVPRRRRAAE
jgi:hypothetical protein